jgi:hypothetical protein
VTPWLDDPRFAAALAGMLAGCTLATVGLYFWLWSLP